MADAALSVSSSVPATLLATASTDQPTTISTSTGTAKAADPFAALLASASDGKPQTVIASKLAAGTRATDPVSTLLASAPDGKPQTAIAGNPAARVSAADPVTALLVRASDGKPQTAIAGNPVARVRAADPVSALLAGTASVAAAPTTLQTPKTLPVIVPQPTADIAPLVADMPSAEADGAAAVPTGDESDDGDAKPDSQSKDPLADAIASGATAVLALAPAIVAQPATMSTPAQATRPASTRIDGAAAPSARARPGAIPSPDRPVAAQTTGQTATAIAASPLVPTDQSQPVPTEDSAQQQPGQPQARQPQVPEPTRSKAQPATASTLPRQPDRIAAVSEQPNARQNSAGLPQTPSIDPNSPAPVHSDAQSPHPRAPSDAAAGEPNRSTDNAKTVAALLRPDDAASATAGDMPVAAITAAAPKPTARADTQPITAQQPRSEPAPIQAPVHGRPDEAPAARRPADTRRQADVAANDGSVTGANQPAPGPRAVNEAPGPAAAQSKGDAVIQQTLTIGRDGAWLDTLARDIASAGNGGDLQFKLDPEHLGSLTVAITHSADGASIRLTADNATTRNLLLDAQPKLLAEARAQGLKVSDTHVDLSQNQAQSQNQTQNQQNQHQPHSQTANQDPSRWAQSGSSQNGNAQNGQNRQSSPGHQPFVSNLRRKAETDAESSDGDSGTRYA